MIMKTFPFFLAALLSVPVHAATYTFDPSHTYPLFEIDHLGFSIQRGQFDTVRGTLEYDPLQRTGSMEIVIDSSSLDSGHQERDEILKGPGWFNVNQFPTITYRGNQFVFEGDRPVAVEGELTLLGVTQPMRLEITRVKCGLNLAARKRGCGADATGVLRRSQFGMRNGLPFVGDEVRLRIQAEAYLEN
jgi:polyisoprenoid-binding protein YceI